MPKYKGGLSPKQKKFVMEYLTNGGNATQAALAAGYSPKTCHVIGGQNLKNVAIRREIEKQEKKEQEKFEVTREEILKIYRRAVEHADNLDQPAVMVSGGKAMSQLFGLDEPTKQHIEIADGLDVKLKKAKKRIGKDN